VADAKQIILFQRTETAEKRWHARGGYQARYSNASLLKSVHQRGATINQ